MLLNTDFESELPSSTGEDSSIFVNVKKQLPRRWDLISPNTKQVDNKRMAIDLSALQQLIWDNRDDCDEKVDGSNGDYPRWIDTSAMLTDCSKKTKNSYLRDEIHCGKSHYQSQKQTVEHRTKSKKNDRWIPTNDTLIAPELNIGIAKFRQNIIEFDTTLVEMLSTSEA